MKRTATRISAALPTTFDELNSLHPLRPINDDVDLANTEEIMDRLAVLNRRNKDQNDYLRTLILLTESYEAEAIADAMNPHKSSALDALKYLMERNEMKQADLARLLKIGASAVSMILSNDRPITAAHARTLSKHFCVTPAAFI